MKLIAMFGVLAALAVTLAEPKAQAMQVQDDVMHVDDVVSPGDAPVLEQAVKAETLLETGALQAHGEELPLKS